MRKTISAFSFLFIIGLPVGFIALRKPAIKPENKVLDYYKKMADSMVYYYDKRHCLFVCDKTDSAYFIDKIYRNYRDSVIHYGNILFSPKTPYSDVESKTNCECD